MSKLYKSRDVRKRYGNVSDMTLHRWTKAEILSKPLYINGQRYWSDKQLEETDRRLSEKMEAA